MIPNLYLKFLYPIIIKLPIPPINKTIMICSNVLKSETLTPTPTGISVNIQTNPEIISAIPKFAGVNFMITDNSWETASKYPHRAGT